MPREVPSYNHQQLSPRTFVPAGFFCWSFDDRRLSKVAICHSIMRDTLVSLPDARGSCNGAERKLSRVIFIMSNTMIAVVKPGPAPGTEIREVPNPTFGPTDVLVKVKMASICGTDLHIYQWDQWAQRRIHPPLIPGHEFCGNVEAVGSEVTSVKEGDFVSAEMHVACGKCLQCRIGEAHICQHVKIIGVDANGAFAEYVVIPETNIWKLDSSIPLEYASILDPLGNAVHTVLAGDIAAKSVAITGCGPIGLFSIAVARACGATQIFALEVNQHRRKIAKQMGPDFVLDPTQDDVYQIVMDNTGGTGVDVVLEMAGRTDAIRTGFKVLRLGGRMSLLGIPSKPVELNLAEEVIFKGATVQGINGRRMYQTWYQMTALLKANKLDLHPVITNRIAMKDFASAMELLKTGEASKILVYPNGTR
jgi:threonine 3-dehydrogenase